MQARPATFKMPAASLPRAPVRTAGANWIYAYLVIQILCQLALLSTALAPSRVIFRSAAFGMSLLFLVIIPGSPRGQSLPRALVLASIALITLCALNPNSGTPLAVFAQWCFHLAILAPIFWVARLDFSNRVIGRTLMILWAFHTAASLTGLLQVYFPGRFQPALTIFLREKHALMIRLSSGEWVPRPMGLSDTPGAVAASGVYAALFGLGLVLGRPFRYARALGAFSAAAGVSCVYLSQVRSGVVVLTIAFVTLIVVLMPVHRLPQLAAVTAFSAIVAIGAFQISYGLAGETATRIRSLWQTDAASVYQANRGMMLTHGFSSLLPQYPLGAGLGHWGMILSYFGKAEDDIGAEIQIVGWIIDGGLPLLVVYSAAVLATFQAAFRAFRNADDTVHRVWAAVIVAYDVSAVALCFSYPVFMGTSGLEFWLLNGALIFARPAEPQAQVGAAPR